MESIGLSFSIWRTLFELAETLFGARAGAPKKQQGVPVLLFKHTCLNIFKDSTLSNRVCVCLKKETFRLADIWTLLHKSFFTGWPESLKERIPSLNV